MAFEKDIEKKIPEAVKTNNIKYAYLVSFIKSYNVDSYKELKSKLEAEKEKYRKDMVNLRNSETNNDIIRELKRKLEHLKDIEEFIEKYLGE